MSILILRLYITIPWHIFVISQQRHVFYFINIKYSNYFSFFIFVNPKKISLFIRLRFRKSMYSYPKLQNEFIVFFNYEFIFTEQSHYYIVGLCSSVMSIITCFARSSRDRDAQILTRTYVYVLTHSLVILPGGHIFLQYPLLIGDSCLRAKDFMVDICGDDNQK